MSFKTYPTIPRQEESTHSWS